MLATPRTQFSQVFFWAKKRRNGLTRKNCDCVFRAYAVYATVTRNYSCKVMKEKKNANFSARWQGVCMFFLNIFYHAHNKYSVCHVHRARVGALRFDISGNMRVCVLVCRIDATITCGNLESSCLAIDNR